MQSVEQYWCEEENRTRGVWVSAPSLLRGRALLLSQLHLVCSQHISKSSLPAWKGSFCLCAFLCLCVCSHQCKESTLSFIFMLSHMLLQPSHVVYTSEHFSLQYPQIFTSQGKDSKLTPIFSMKCWPLSHKLSSYFRKRLVWTENKGIIKTGEEGPFHWPQQALVEILCVQLCPSLSLKKRLKHTLQPSKLLMWNTARGRTDNIIHLGNVTC